MLFRSHIFLIDNGKTLDANREIQKVAGCLNDKLDIIPNMNAGGSGGFTRGMIEILNRKEQDGYTHVLLMDDDAVVQPDMMVRLYGLLTTLKEEWSSYWLDPSAARLLLSSLVSNIRDDDRS